MLPNQHSRNVVAAQLEAMAAHVRHGLYEFATIAWSDDEGTVQLLVVPGAADETLLDALGGVQRLTRMITTSLEQRLHDTVPRRS